MKHHDARDIQQYAHILALVCLAYERLQFSPKYALVYGHKERHEVATIYPGFYTIVVGGVTYGIVCCLLRCQRAISLAAIKRHVALCLEAGFK